MTAALNLPGFDGLMALSRREGVDVRPTLLRVLTDLYVQTERHSEEERQHYVALASRLIDEVDDATRAMVRARLSIYPQTPPELAGQLGLAAAAPDAPPAQAAPEPDIAGPDAADRDVATPDDASPPAQAMLPLHATELSEMFFAADSGQRRLMLEQLDAAPLPRAAHVTPRRLDRAIETLEQAAFIGSKILFALELGNVLMLPSRLAERIVDDGGGEALVCAAKALGVPQAVFERILLFLDATRGASVTEVYRLARLYEALTMHAAGVLLAALRGASFTATRARYAAHLYDDERTRSRQAAAAPPRAASPRSRARKAAVNE